MPRRAIPLLIFLGAVLSLLLSARTASADRFVQIRVEGVINPIKARYLDAALERARREHASFVLVSLDTPGGLVSSMQDITRSLTNSEIPIVGFVEPETAQASSAGAFILLACDVAAMAPSTRVGAAHPVGEGKPLEGVLDDKVTNSLASLAKSLAARRGRPQAVAESFVRESKSLTAEEAKAAGIVEIIAPNVDDLLRQLDGREPRKDGRALRTSGIERIVVPPSRIEKLLDVLANPTLASIFMTLGVLGILYELSSPGVGMAGIVGVIALVVGLGALSVLPLALTGFLLVASGLTAIGLEIKLQTHGLLAVGGVAALVLGAMFLVDESQYFGGAQRVDWRVFAPFVVVVTALFLLIAGVALRARRERFGTGSEAMVGKRGGVKADFVQARDGFAGTVFVDGALWSAVAKEPLTKGGEITVVRVLTGPTRLEVEPVEKGSS